MPEQDADVFEILIGQVAKRRDIDPILGKALRVLGHAERFEPVRNLLHRSPASGGVILAQPNFWSKATDRFSDKFLARYSAGLDRPSKCPRRCCGAPKSRRQRSSWIIHDR